MKTEKQPIILIDERKINEETQYIGFFADLLQKGKQEYLKVFECFDIAFFQKLTETKNLRGDLIKRWVEENKIDLRGIKMEVALQMGLLDLPDFSGLNVVLGTIQSRISQLPPRYPSLVRSNLALLFSEEMNDFPRPDQGTTDLYDMVKQDNTVTTESDEEVEFVLDVMAYAKLYKKFRGYNVVNEQERARLLFNWEGPSDEELFIPPSALIHFRSAQKGKN